jgi:U-box domain.
VTGSGGGTAAAAAAAAAAVELGGGGGGRGLEDATGSVRVIVEYDCAESHPRVGDKVRFHGFVESRLCPLPKSQVFRVDHVMGDEVILSFITPVENWKCTFQAHRFMLIPVERHVSALERYQEELLNLTLKLANSPAADIVSETVNSLPEEGILFVGMQAAFGGLSLLERWREKGLSTAVEDFVHVTNLDGHQTLDSYDDMNQDISSTEDDSFVVSHDDISSLDRSEDVDLDDHDDNNDDDDDESVESGMPCCPITGQPMRRPVVAADGGTYERSAIQRWLRSSDMSPLTGVKLKHKDLIPNYLLISSLQSWKRRSKDHQISQI